MPASWLLDEMTRRGINVKRVGAELEYVAPPGEMTAADVARLAANKEDLLVELERREASPVASILVDRVKADPIRTRPAVATTTIITSRATTPPRSLASTSTSRSLPPRESASGRFTSPPVGPSPGPQKQLAAVGAGGHSRIRHALYSGEGCSHPDCLREFSAADDTEAPRADQIPQAVHTVQPRKRGILARVMWGDEAQAG